jgi:HTH-type transcriptional regulator/antitoxin HigA
MAASNYLQLKKCEIGSQGVVSEILTGKRELNLRQVRALGERFGVSAATFL